MCSMHSLQVGSEDCKGATPRNWGLQGSVPLPEMLCQCCLMKVLWTPFLQSKKNRCHPKLRRHGFVWFAVLLVWRKSKKEHVLRVRLNNIEHDVFAHQTLALRTKESVLDRHWKEMFDRMGDSAPKPALYGNDYKKVTLQMMLDHNINEFTQDFEELSTAAAKQHGLKKAMGNMKVGHGFADKLGRIWAYLGMFVPKQQDDWYQSVPFILHMHIHIPLTSLESLISRLQSDCGTWSLIGSTDAVMQVDWEPLEFLTAERNGVPLLRGIDEIQTVLDDHISKTQAIRSSCSLRLQFSLANLPMLV